MNDSELNEWGERGWELVGFVHASPSQTNVTNLVMDIPIFSDAQKMKSE